MSYSYLQLLYSSVGRVYVVLTNFYLVRAFLTMTICARISARLRKSEKVEEGEDRETVGRWRDTCGTTKR